MEQLPLFCFLAAIFFTVLTVFTRRGHKPTLRLPRAPILPVIGSLHHLIGSELPHRRLRELARHYGPHLMLVRLGQVDYVVVSSRDAAEDVLKTNDVNFSSRTQLAALDSLTYGYTNIAFSPYGDYWRQLKKICVTELLTAKRVKSFGSVREEEILKIVKKISASGHEAVSLSSMLMSLANDIVFRAVMGKKCRHQEKFLAVTKEGIKLVTGMTVTDMFPWLRFLDVVSGTSSRLERLHRSLDEIVDEIVEEHEKALPSKNGKDYDFLDVLLRLNNAGELEIPLTRANIKAVIGDMFAAGTDTSAATIEWAMSELMKNPGTMKKAQTEIRQALVGKTKLEESDFDKLKYLKLVIKETLRLHPPAPLLPRECIQSCQVQGYAIPKGQRVLVNLWALGRDPEHWDYPNRFKPERFDGCSIDFKGTDFSYLPFGAGRRICPGIAFSMATVELVLANLLNYFDWELADGMNADELDMCESFSASVSRKSELRLLATSVVPLPAV